MQQVMFWDFQTWALLKWQHRFPLENQLPLNPKSWESCILRMSKLFMQRKAQRGTSRCHISVWNLGLCSLAHKCSLVIDPVHATSSRRIYRQSQVKLQKHGEWIISVSRHSQFWGGLLYSRQLMLGCCCYGIVCNPILRLEDILSFSSFTLQINNQNIQLKGRFWFSRLGWGWDSVFLTSS